MFCRLFLLRAKDICNRTNVKGQNNNSDNSVVYSVDLCRWWHTVLPKCWYMAQDVKQTSPDITLIFFQKFTFVKYVTAAGKQTSLSSGTRLQQWLLGPSSGKFYQPVSNLIVFNYILLGRVKVKV